MSERESLKNGYKTDQAVRLVVAAMSISRFVLRLIDIRANSIFKRKTDGIFFFIGAFLQKGVVTIMKANKVEHIKLSIWKVFNFGLKTNMKIFPMEIIAISVVGMISGICMGVTTYMTQQFFDSLTSDRAYFMLAVLGLTMIVREIVHGAHIFLHEVVMSKANGEMSKIIHMKMTRIDPVCLENTMLHDDIEKASNGASHVTWLIVLSITTITYYLPYFLFMGFYLQNLNPMLILAIVFVFVPILLSQFIRTGIVAKFEDKAAPIRRQYDYYKKVISHREYYKETRILGAYSFFIVRLMSTMKKLSKTEWKMVSQTNWLELGMEFLSAAGYTVIIFMLVTTLLKGDITVGAFAAVFSSIGILYSTMEEMIRYGIGDIASSMGTAHNFVRFMELPERGGVTRTPHYEKGIIADHISFIYPNAEKKSVDDVSLTIKAGETVAIVGENGAGKSTLVRLLIGLYIPTAGNVALNGMDTATTDSASLFNGLSGVFQRFQRYQMTLQGNIQISEIHKNGEITEAMNKAGVDSHSRRFPEGVKTMLSREFGGVDLSGGEWQRVAIARGLYRINNIVVLDEPTASIDPIEESIIYRKFIEISKGKTAIIITHRLGSARIADRILVMNHSRIVEMGSHDELMKKKGFYAELYQSQAEWYKE